MFTHISLGFFNNASLPCPPVVLDPGTSPFVSSCLSLVLHEKFPGDHGEEATPVPIPNTVVKLLIADGTAIIRVVGE